jgi:hypothetical protein
MRDPRLAGFAVLLALLAFGPVPGAPVLAFAADTVERLAAPADEVRFVFRPGAPERSLRRVDGADIATLEWSGLGRHGGLPGEPFLPVRVERLLVPAGHDWTLDFSVRGGVDEDAIDFERVPEPVERLRQVGAEALPAADPDGLYPASLVTTSVERFRGQDLLLIALSPLQFDAGARRATWYDDIEVRVRFTPRARAAGGEAPRRIDGSPALLGGLVLNPEAAATGFTGVRDDGRDRDLFGASSPGAAALALPDVYFDDAPTWVKLVVRQNGLYRVTAGQLAAAGLDPRTIDPTTLRVFAGPGTELSEATAESAVPAWNAPGGFREQAIHVSEAGAPNGQFDEADTLLYYGLAVDNFADWFDPAAGEEWIENEHTSDNVYWLTWGGAFPNAPLRMVAESAGAGGPEVTTVRDRLHAEVNDPALFDPVPREAGIRWERWWWQRIDDNGSSYFWDIPLPDIDTSRPTDVFIRWWGFNTPPHSAAEPTRRHFLRVSVNDDPELSVSWGGVNMGITRYDMDLPQSTSRATTRVVGTVTRFPNSGIRIDQILLAWMEFTYWKTLSLSRDVTWFEGDSAGDGPVTFRVTGAKGPSFVFDVTEPWAPRRIPATLAGDVLTFGADAPAGRRYLAANASAIRAPAAIRRDDRHGPLLRTTDPGADYIIITGDEFLAAAEDLADWRRANLRGITTRVPGGPAPREARVRVARISDIYDEFSGGVADPTAIRNFLQHAFENWGGATPELPAPYFVCLIGDANRDTRDREGTGVRNIVPSWQDGYDTGTGQDTNPNFNTDDFFARFDGPGDLLTDMAIGRLPVSDASAAATLVNDKVIGVEQFSGLDPKRNRAILVADDVCQIGRGDPLTTVHILQTESVERHIPGAFDRVKVYLYDYGQNDCSILSKPAAKRDLIAAMNEGGWLVNYIGHGGDQVLADEKILETTDVSSLSNGDDLSVLVAASCSVGKFDRSGTEGLAEALIKWPSGGCLGTVAATHLSFPGENQDLNIRFFDALFPLGDNRSTALGHALLVAKIAQTRACDRGQTICNRPAKYLLFGDPAAVIVGPDRQVRITDLPDTLGRGQAVTVSGEVLRPDSTVDLSFDGVVDLLAQDQVERRLARNEAGFPTEGHPYLIPGATIFSGRVPVTAGRFTATFVVPVSIRGGAGRVRAFAAGPDHDAVGSAEGVPIGGLSAGAPTDTTAPVITWPIAGGRVAPGEALSVVVEDESGINLTRLFEFRSILFTLLDEEGLERFRSDVTGSFEYESGSYRRGVVSVRVPDLPPGRYTLRLTATDNFNNRGEGRIDVQLSRSGSGGAIGSLFANPNPFGKSTEILFDLERGSDEVRVALFSVSGRRVRSWSLTGVAGQNSVRWDGTDEEGDPVANGVYLVRVSVRGADGKEEDRIDPIVRLR